MKDAGKYITAGADGDTIVWDTSATQTPEFQTKAAQVERILESEGLIASEDAILKFFAVQRNIWNSQ